MIASNARALAALHASVAAIILPLAMTVTLVSMTQRKGIGFAGERASVFAITVRCYSGIVGLGPRCEQPDRPSRHRRTLPANSGCFRRRPRRVPERVRRLILSSRNTKLP